PVNGWLSRYIGKKRLLIATGIIALIDYLVLLYSPFSSVLMFSILTFISGFTASAMLLCFALNNQLHSASSHGLVTAFTNMMIMIIGGHSSTYHW
ncbi:hypothetical protein, partial [Piscirickettsia litoralis]|uniref:hypothetical protein n=1 Tax=Piscirickettsia litoralis TaxID=1891921 RepID=UPI0019126321